MCLPDQGSRCVCLIREADPVAERLLTGWRIHNFCEIAVTLLRLMEEKEEDFIQNRPRARRCGATPAFNQSADETRTRLLCVCLLGSTAR